MAWKKRWKIMPMKSTFWLKHDLQLICANQTIVQIGEQVIYCAGALAEIYENNGGDVIGSASPICRFMIRALTDSKTD